MGWWEQRSSACRIAIVAQVAGAVGLGAGAFFPQFISPDLSVKPVFLAIAGGLGTGGSIGSSVRIP